MKTVKIVSIGSLMVALSACGGGGGSAAADPTPAPVAGVAPVAPAPVDAEPDTIGDKGPGTGTDSTPSPEPAPAPTPTPTPTPTPVPVPVPAPSPVSGADIDLSQPFSQSMNCYYGAKPYYEVSPEWLASYDGDALQLQSLNSTEEMGGSFGQSGNAVVRENYGASALQRTILGAAGGEIWFVKNLAGQIISTGHNRFGGYDSSGSVVECGDSAATQWVAAPASTPFAIDFVAERVNWGAGTVAVSCKGTLTTNGTSAVQWVADGNLNMVAGVEITFSENGGSTTQIMAANTATQVFNYQRYGAGSLTWISNDAAGAGSQRLDLDGKARLLVLTNDSGVAGQPVTTCVPQGLQP